MKKILLIFACLFPFMVHAQKIKIYPKAAISYCDETVRMVDVEAYRYSYTMPKILFRNGMDINYKHLSISYDIRVWCSDKCKVFCPEQSTFEIGANYQLNNKIKINISHVFRHPMFTDDGQYKGGIYGDGNYITVSYGY